MDNPACNYCENAIWHSAKWSPECLPDDIPSKWFREDNVAYHPSCLDIVIDEARQEIAMKHGADDPGEAAEWHSFDPDC